MASGGTAASTTAIARNVGVRLVAVSALGARAWINPAGIQALRDAASSYSQMATRVQDAARKAADGHVGKQARRNGAPADTGVFSDDSGMYLGLPSDHPQAESAFNDEFGLTGGTPKAALRKALWSHGDRARQAFEQHLQEPPPSEEAPS